MRLHALLRRIVDVRPEEVRALLWSFAYFFCLLCSYYILRPVRDEMGILGGVKNLPWLFTGTFVAMLAAVPIYSAAVARWPRRRFVPLVSAFFAVNVLVFTALLWTGAGKAHVARVFFIWTSVFNLFVVSVFWSVMADVWRSEQGKRLFGFIAAGGSAGALVGSGLTAMLAASLGIEKLLLASAALLFTSIACVGRLLRVAPQAQGAPPGHGEERIGGGVLAGVVLVVRSPYLLALCGQTLLLTLTSTVLYFEQAEIVKRLIPDSGERTAFFGTVDLVVNLLTLVLQALATGRIVARLGLGFALAVLPILTGVGFAALAATPMLWVLVGFQGVRRAVHFALERPAREVLFTVLGREEKYKAKSFIDTVVYRGGDALSGWAHPALVAVGLGGAAMSLSMIPVAAAWLVLMQWLARRHAKEGLREDRARGRE